MTATQGFRGMSFPFRLTPDYTGGVVTSTTTPTEPTHIEEAIRQIVSTYLGERWMNHRFGAAPLEGVGSPMDRSLEAHYSAILKDKLVTQEDRADFPVVQITFDMEEGTMWVHITYVIRQTLFQGQLTEEVTVNGSP